MSKFSVSINEAIAQLSKEPGKKFTTVLKHGSMSIEYYAPGKIDTQTPHLQDEIYVIASGNSSFYRDGATILCSTGDVLFVPAGMVHRFENFSSDFATWVIFYGAEGGEKSGL